MRWSCSRSYGTTRARGSRATPFAGMAVELSRARDTANCGGVTYAFCSSTCADLFRAAPARSYQLPEIEEADYSEDAAAVRLRGGQPELAEDLNADHALGDLGACTKERVGIG